jgi:large subunit ribosomal protein L3
LLPRADCEPQRFVREFRGVAEGVAVGQQVTVEVFEKIAAVDVIGISKGKGFQGAMKRHNFKGQRATHGVKKVHRHIGGTSGNTFPGRTFKGKKMAGHMGDARTTSRNLKVVRVDKENNLLVIRGAVPGAIGGYVAVRQSNKLR